MKYFTPFIISLLFYTTTYSGPLDQYNSARKQFILEYTVFGVDECLKQSGLSLVVNESDAIEGKILVGSASYFQLLASCFKKIKSTCTGESCIVSESMSKRLENVRHIDLMKERLKQRISNTPNKKTHIMSKK